MDTNSFEYTSMKLRLNFEDRYREIKQYLDENYPGACFKMRYYNQCLRRAPIIHFATAEDLLVYTLKHGPQS